MGALVQRFIDDLRTDYPDCLDNTAPVLHQLSDAGLEVVPSLLEMMKGTNDQHHLAAIAVLADIYRSAKGNAGEVTGLASAEQALIRQLASPSQFVRIQATPLSDEDGPRLADEVLAAVAAVTQEIDAATAARDDDARDGPEPPPWAPVQD